MRTFLKLNLIILCLIITSCIKDEIPNCPPLQVKVVVKDKNYFNINQIEYKERVDENLPFRDYVPTYYYILRDVVTGNQIDSSFGVLPVLSDDKELIISFCDCIPYGKYILTVWGGLENEKGLSDTFLNYDLHNSKENNPDVYLSTDTLNYSFIENNQVIELERVKGDLLVVVENLPTLFNKGTLIAENVSKSVDFKFNYKDSVKYDKSFLDWEVEYSKTLFESYLSPSPRSQFSKISLLLEEENKRLDLDKIFNEISVPIKRNEIALVKVIYNTDLDHTIFIWINDRWEEIHNSTLD